MTDKQCKEAEKKGLCSGVCDQCMLDNIGNPPRKEFGMPKPKKKRWY